MKSYGNYPDESTEWWEDSEMIMNDDAVDAFEWDLIPEEEEEEKILQVPLDRRPMMRILGASTGNDT